MNRLQIFHNVDNLVERDRNIKDKKLKNRALYLEPSLAIDYVKKIDAKHEEFKFFIYHNYIHDDKDIMQYIHFYYEDLLVASYNKNLIYWRMIESFLEIDHEIQSINTLTYIREHPLPCYQKIKNWNELKDYLRNSTSFAACEKLIS